LLPIACVDTRLTPSAARATPVRVGRIAERASSRKGEKTSFEQHRDFPSKAREQAAKSALSNSVSTAQMPHPTSRYGE
jgi:hypothetical protein